MDSSTPADVVLVLNAGSSSLKFAMYASAGALAWQAVARGQIEGIGTTPRMIREGRGRQPAAGAGARIESSMAGPRWPFLWSG